MIEQHASGLFYTRHHCMLCGAPHPAKVVDLAPTSILNPNTGILKGDAAPRADDLSVPLDLHLCETCGHLQLVAIGDPKIQYATYTYRTSVSRGLAQHFQSLVADLSARLGPVADRFAVEIGSNDGTVLRLLQQAGFRTLGIDPAEAIAREATLAGAETIVGFFDSAAAERIKAERGPAAIIVANNVLANIDDLAEIMAGVRLLLQPDGMLVFETQYGADVIEHCLIDTIYHEHISYFLIGPLARFLAAHGLELFDVVRIPTKGGSIRCFVQQRGAPRPVAAAVADFVAAEHAAGLGRTAGYVAFNQRVQRLSRRVHDAVAATIAEGGRVAGFGVSIGTMTLMSQFNIAYQLALLIDDDPEKHGVLKGAGFEIPVRPATALLAEPPALVLVFAWRYLASVLAATEAYREAGGELLVPLPEPVRIGADGIAVTLG
ncbi:MAG TPA: methyltransferase domain-containing protein [Aliidongia sp.]|nr:methyltransferase domain-containing protein [Aliidongia sp.]